MGNLRASRVGCPSWLWVRSCARVLYMCCTYQVLLVHGWTNRTVVCDTIVVTFRSQGYVVVVAASEGMRRADMGICVR